MKINKKLIIFIPIFVAIAVFIGVYLYYYSEDINSLTVTDKNWIEENVTSLVDIEVISDYPIYGEGEGVFDSFISGFENATGVEFNKVTYVKEGTPNTKSYRFRVLSSNEKLTEKDLLINEDVYILVSLESRNYDHISDLNKLVVGVLAADLEDVSYYMSSGTNLTYKSYASSEDLFNALNNGSVNTIVVPHIMYLNKILSSDTNYYINYTLSEMSKSVVFTLSDTNSKLNDIFVKYFNSWKNNSFVSVYNSELFDFYVNSKGITDSVKKELQAETYVYGYVENSPYEIVVDDNFYGIAAEYVNRINRLSGVDFEYKKYDSVEDLKKAIDKKEIDIYFNYYDVAGKDYKEVNSTFIEEYVVLARTKDSHVVGSFQALKGKDISMLANTALLNYFKDNSKSNIKEFNDYNEMLSKSDNNILVIDREVYTYYKNSKFKDYEVLYSDCIPKNYSFMIVAEEENFYDMFNYTISTNSYYRYRNAALIDLNSDNILRTNSFEELYVVILVLILVPVLFFIAIYILFKRKSVVKKVRKEERRKYTDNLTSLKNRSYLNLNMEAWNKSEKYPQAIVMIDLNNVKYVNDNYGHEAGDGLIVQAASTLVNTQLENSEIIRTDGNEFLIYLVGYSEKQVEIYTKKLTKEFKDLPYGFGAAIGYSMITDGMKTIDDAINEATLEMRTDKEDYK
ncbi:MAG: GGDEF domain-containing protein [Firmicutes bacterium]|nr:GGDEF domain-containing protein [Bacillota bacterium]